MLENTSPPLFDCDRSQFVRRQQFKAECQEELANALPQIRKLNGIRRNLFSKLIFYINFKGIFKKNTKAIRFRHLML